MIAIDNKFILYIESKKFEEVEIVFKTIKQLIDYYGINENI